MFHVKRQVRTTGGAGPGGRPGAFRLAPRQSAVSRETSTNSTASKPGTLHRPRPGVSATVSRIDDRGLDIAAAQPVRTPFHV